MNPAITPKEITDAMMEKDYFSQWLGIERIQDGEGISVLQMVIRKEMCNGFGIAHGGVSYSLADSALAFASNSHGKHAVSIETSISHIKPLVEGDVIRASARLLSMTKKIALYDVVVERDGDVVAVFKGTVYRKDINWTIAK